jgi:predicted nuclease of predicted toxin-antitoxin system
MYRLVLDENLPLGLVPELGRRGVDAIHVSATKLKSAPGQSILEAAIAENRIVVTLDRGLLSILATTGPLSPSVILLRMQQYNPRNIAAIVEAVLEQTGDFHAGGAAVTVTKRGIRARTLLLMSA